jgi:hypothetical protein
MELKKGDRVAVEVPFAGRGSTEFTGTIVGESRDGHAWQIVKDGTKFARGIHKSFCQPEAPDRSA